METNPQGSGPAGEGSENRAGTLCRERAGGKVQPYPEAHSGMPYRSSRHRKGRTNWKSHQRKGGMGYTALISHAHIPKAGLT